MAYSMTGFGRGEAVFDTRSYSVEIKSVNSRFCDINIRMPRLFNFTDAQIRKNISDALGRGKLDVYINFDDRAAASSEVAVNEGLAKAYSEAVAGISALTGREDDTTAGRIALFQDVMTVRQTSVDEEKLAEELLSVVDSAVGEMLRMRRTEGENLTSDILDKINELQRLRDEIASRAPSVVSEYRERLSSRVSEILSPENAKYFDEARLASEVALFADKCAIDEELKRLLSHFDQGKRIIACDKGVGKKMDFLIQEINREVNTIGSKANDIEITNRVLAMKNLIEEMREQVQNLV